MSSSLNWVSFPKLGFEFNVDPTAFTIFGIEVGPLSKGLNSLSSSKSSLVARIIIKSNIVLS